MAKKNVINAFNDMLVDQESQEAQEPKKEVITSSQEPETAAPKKQRKQRKKAIEGVDYTVLSTRISPEAHEFINNYAYTKRLSVQQAISKIVLDYKKSYEKNPKNEKILEKG